MLISPTEPKALKEIGTVSSQCEEYGSDVLIPTAANGLVGIQRKEIHDYVNSIRNGLLGVELSKMKATNLSILVLEGTCQFSITGTCLNIREWSLAQHQGSLLSLQSQSCWVLPTAHLEETIQSIYVLKKWLDKEVHTLMRGRPNPKSMWGTSTSRDWGIHLMSGLPGISSVLAGRIWDKYGVPLKWTIDELDFLMVEGIGLERVKKIMGALSGTD